MQWRKKQTIQQVVLAKPDGYPPTEDIYQIHMFHIIQNSTRWSKDLNLKPETLKLSDENTGNTLPDIEINKTF